MAQRAEFDSTEASMIEAFKMGRWLDSGGAPEVLDVPILLEPGEHCFATGQTQIQIYAGADASYQHSSMVALGGVGFMAAAYGLNAIGNARRRSAAARAAAPQWRYDDHGVYYLTNHRLALQGALGWNDIWLSYLRALDTDHDGLLLWTGSGPPLRVRCPFVGRTFVLLHYLRTGRVPPYGLDPDLYERARNWGHIPATHVDAVRTGELLPPENGA